MSILTDDICVWRIAQTPKGIAPQAFSWLDCRGARNYGIPLPRICTACGNTIAIEAKPGINIVPLSKHDNQ